MSNPLKVAIMSLLLFIFIYLQYQLWFGQGTYQEYNSLTDLIKQQQQENAQLEIRNKTLEAEVIDLKQGLETIEEQARLELGMIKEGEVFYQVVE